MEQWRPGPGGSGAPVKRGALTCPRSDGGRGATKRWCHRRSGTGLALSKGRGWRALVRVRSGDAGPVSVSPWVEGTGFSQRAAWLQHVRKLLPVRGGVPVVTRVHSLLRLLHPKFTSPRPAPETPQRLPRLDPLTVLMTPASVLPRGWLSNKPGYCPRRRSCGLASTSCAARSSTVAGITPSCQPSA